MTALTGVVSATKGDILQMSNSGSGVDGTLRTVKDGNGVSTTLKLHTSYGGFGNITFNGNTISTSTGDLNISANSGVVNLIGASFSDISVTGGLITGITDIAVADGGTGASTAANARTNLGVAIGSNVQAYNSTLDAVAGGTYTGAVSITTLGTIATGVWNGTGIAAGYLANNAVTTASIATNAVTLAKLATQADKTILGNNAGSTAVPTAIAIATVADMFTAQTSQSFTTGSGTYTTPTNCKRIRVRCWGAGGAGGGSATSSGATSAAASGGGGAGAYCETIITAPSGTYSYAVGAAGAAPSAGNNSGGNGGSTTFGSLTAGGGAGGSGGAASVGTGVGAFGGNGGSASGGLINIAGSKGGKSFIIAGASAPADGATGALGAAGGSGGLLGAGTAGTAPGGGGGGCSTGNSSATAGGAGGAGLIVVEEMYV